MRSDRRHELQTNELSTQIEKVSETVKQNATLLTAVIGGAIVVIAVGVWFVNQRANAQTDAWNRLGEVGTEETPTTELLTKFEAVAKDNVSPAITRSAWLKVGRIALGELIQDRKESEAPDPEARKALLARAEEAFNAIVSNPGQDVTALGRALMGLGTIAENRGEFDKAKGFYERVKSDASLKNTPIADEAEYKLTHLSEWLTMITFPEPPSILLTNSPSDSVVPPGTFKPPADFKPMAEISQPSESIDTELDESSAEETPADASDDAADDETAAPDNG